MKPLSKRRVGPSRGVTLIVIGLMAVGLLYEVLINQPRSDRQLHEFESTFARVGVLPGAGFESESRVSKNGVAVLSRCYTTERGLDAIAEYYDRALASQGWTRRGEEGRPRAGGGFPAREYTNGDGKATVEVTGQASATRWRYCVTFTQ
jgi:hypothetical protein